MDINAGTIMAYMDMDMSGFNAAMESVSKQMSGFTGDGVSGALRAIGGAAETAGRALTVGVSTPLVGLAAAAVKVGSDFDSSMSNVYSLMSSLNLTGEQMEALRDTAREMGATTKFSASEAADAMGYMALAGWDDQEVIAGLPGVLNLAAAANMDLARASDIVTDTMTPFSMGAEEAARAADVFALAQASSNTTVESLGEAMKMVAPSAASFGMTLEDTSAALGLLANAGIKGSLGGTTLNAMLRDMKKNANDGAIAIGDTEVAIANADGSYRSYTAIIRDVNTATQGMSEAERDAALANIFGDEALKGILATLSQGPDALDTMTASFYDASGAAEEMAAVTQDNLAGDLAVLSSGAQDMAISLSDFVTPALRSAVQWISGAVEWFNNLDDGVKNIIFRAGALAAAAGPVLLNGGKLLSLLGRGNPLVAVIGGALAAGAAHSERFSQAIGLLKDGAGAFFAVLQDGGGFLDALSAGFSTIFGEDALAQAQSFLSGVTEGLSSIGEAVSTVIDAAGTFIGALFDGEGLSSAFDQAMGVLGGFDWAQLGQMIWDGVTGVLGAAGEFLSDIFSKGLELVRDVDWNGVGTAIHNGVLSVIDSAGQFLANLFGFGRDAAERVHLKRTEKGSVSASNIYIQREEARNRG